MKSIIQKGIIPARTQSKDKKFQTSRPCEVRRSGHSICCLCSFLLELSSCCVNYENCYKSSVVVFFFNLVSGEWTDLTVLS